MPQLDETIEHEPTAMGFIGLSNSMPSLRAKWRLATLNGWRCLLVAFAMFTGNACIAADSPIRNVDVTYDGETYVLDARMFAPVSRSVAWDVLIDFDHMARWVPNVSESKVLKREDNTVTIEQRGVAKYGLASIPYVTERKVEITVPDVIKSTQIKGSLRRVESMMMVEPDGNGTRLNYHLEIVPSGLASALLSKAFLEHEISEQFGAIIGEMVRRAQ